MPKRVPETPNSETLLRWQRLFSPSSADAIPPNLLILAERLETVLRKRAEELGADDDEQGATKGP